MSKKKGIDLDTQKIVAWCKSNLVLVILIIVSIGAIAGLPQVGAGVVTTVETELKSRVENFKKLNGIKETRVKIPGSNESETVVVNKSLLDEYKTVVDSLVEDAKSVVDRSLALNKKQYKVILAGRLFPTPDIQSRETLPQDFYEQLVSDYEALLVHANAGSATSNVELASYLEDARVRFMETNLSTRQDADLTKEQRSSLELHLAKFRMSYLRTHAEDISVYLEQDGLGIPVMPALHPSPSELFVWQWRYWEIADMVGAVASINNDQTEITSPIKRIISLEVMGLPTIDGDANKGGGTGGSGGGIAPPPTPMRPPGSPNPFGGPRGGGTPSPAGPSGGGGSPSPGGFGKPPRGGSDTGLTGSYTGRSTGELYDLHQVRLTLIVDTQRIPVILDGLSAYNFLTVIDIDLQPADKFVALGNGFDYGPASVSQLTVVMESAWLRAWTTEYMPDEVKKAIGIEVND